MTDEEKAKDIVKSMNISGPWQEHLVHDAILRSMNWKDSQFSEEKKELLGLVRMLPVDEHSQTIIEDLVSMLE